jgi:two-component system alkaline phosphatase synthesis response regulator PhoP
MAKRILLVEDEENLRSTIRLNLELENYDVTEVRDGKTAYDTFRSAHFDLIVLDVMLPEMDGYTLCRKIRMENTEVPVLFLTAKGSSDERVQGLKLGADDYLAKPFNLQELLLRVSNLVKRSVKSPETRIKNQLYKFGGNEINFATYEIKSFKGERQTVSKREINLLKLLIEKKNEVVSREEILKNVWEYDVYPSTRTIDNYIVNFRKYFEKNPREPKYFFSVRGVGYKFTE